MQSVSPHGRFIKSSKIAGRQAIDGFSILRRSLKRTRRPNLKAFAKICLMHRWPRPPAPLTIGNLALGQEAYQEM